MKEDIKNLEEIINLCKEEINNNDKNITATLDLEDLKSLENLLTRYKQLDSLIGEIDNKEVNDALHMLLHCALKNTEYETQKQQFEIVNAYIKQLEEENEELRADNYELNNRITDLLENIPVQKVKENIQDLESRGYFEEANAMKDLLERSREDGFI